jgi:ankyrin repeat protein
MLRALHENSAFLLLLLLQKSRGAAAVNYRTTKGGWSALMVTAGSNLHGPRDVARVLALGALPLVRDVEGWTAVHWAAFHGIPHSLRVIAACFGPSPTAGSDGPLTTSETKALRGLPPLPTLGPAAALKALLAMESNDGLTALELATQEGNTEAAAVLVALGAEQRKQSKKLQAPQRKGTAAGAESAQAVEVLGVAASDVAAPASSSELAQVD